VITMTIVALHAPLSGMGLASGVTAGGSGGRGWQPPPAKVKKGAQNEVTGKYLYTYLAV